ncbi:PHD finger protein ALFIN-LIKE 1 isoform X1 [Vigna radiata var. radiata]|uniref:PHD finger protein ALFIN-LIKE n=1 Tax=Vigna radiata var. radiata TaxID=3916 RepID=A0A1S3VNU0_VIGRR|nr:PHD finger protein ALFIN-LIKE 1 isoform X1 [Vigna radiata var. radiata]
MASKPRTVEEIFKDFRARRNAIIRALTHDVDEFYGLCDPGKDNLCLYGHPNGAWEVALPSEEVPPELPEPALGINFARDDLSRKDWLSLVAVHSDSWLLAVAFYLGTRLNHNERKRLFGLINALSTVFQVATGNKPIKEKLTMDSGSKSDVSIDGAMMKGEPIKIFCGSCGGKYTGDELWIGCDICEWWYHGRCVMINPAKADTLKRYKCPACSLRRSRSKTEDNEMGISDSDEPCFMADKITR